VGNLGKTLCPIAIEHKARAIRYIFFIPCHWPHFKKKDAAPVPFAKKDGARPVKY